MDDKLSHGAEKARLGLRIAQLRAERNLSQRSLAAIVGIDRPNLNAIESGRGNPTFDTLVRIAHGLSLDVEDLFDKSMSTEYFFVRGNASEPRDR